MPEHSETSLHPYARLSSSLWTAGMPQADRESTLHRQARRLPRRHAVAR